MDIVLFSNSKTIPEVFSELKKSADFDLILYPPDVFIETVEEIPQCQIVYLDIQSFDSNELDKNLAFMCASPVHWFGIIDPKNDIEDIATLFHQGITDYIPKKQLKANPITPERIKRMLAYRECQMPESIHSNRRRILIKKPENGWEGITEEHEYSFVMLLVRVEKLSHLQNNYGYTFSDKIMTSYYDYLKKIIISKGGRPWLTDAHHTLYLFPFQNNNSTPILTTYSFMFNAPIISGEYVKSPVLISSTMLLHLGNITYLKQERAGRSISPALNFIFHAANSSVTPGRLYVTDTLFTDIPQEIGDLFVDSGNFEGHDLKVMRRNNYCIV